MDDTLLRYFNLLITLLKRKTGVHFLGFFKKSSSFKNNALEKLFVQSSISRHTNAGVW